MRHCLLAAALLLLSVCTGLTQPSANSRPQARTWRQVATEADRTRLRDWRRAWTEALRAANAACSSAPSRAIAALPGPAIPNGTYRCRLTKLGARTPGLLDYVAYPAFACRVRQEGEVQGFAKLTGSQRQAGLLFPHDGLRSVFLGTLILGDETRAMQYGADSERDVAGYLERVGPGRWRVVMPYPRFESLVDVLELVPA